MEWKQLINDLNQNVGQKYDNSMKAVLDRVGLQEKRSTAESVLPMLGIFGAGIAVGATLGVLFAPKRGEAIRHDIRDSLQDLQQRGKIRASELAEGEFTSEGNSRAEAE